MAVYLALNPDKRTPRLPSGDARVTRPHSTRISLSTGELAALQARAKSDRLSMAALVRAIVFAGAPSLQVEPKLEP